jgi:hypothetical protein
MKQQTVMVSLDTSSSETGVSIFVNGKRKKCYSLTSDKKGEDALNEMSLNLCSELRKINPDICICEMTVVERSAHTQRLLSELVGVCRGWCVCNGTFFDRMRPTEWRRMICEKYSLEAPPKKRDDLKKWSLWVTREIIGVDFKNNDNISDSYLIGEAYDYYVNQYGEEE